MARIEFLEECESTNLVVRDGSYSHGDAAIARSQSAGRGQRGNKWSSSPGENLTFSMVLEPVFMPAVHQFLLSEAVALALVDTFTQYGIDTRIKWTNDIYSGDRKITGVLIENDLMGANLCRSIVGIGVNVNQRVFPEWVPNPTSMTLETGGQFDIHEVFATLYGNIMSRHDMLEGDAAGELQREYNGLLYRLGERHGFRIPGQGEVTGMIEGVEPTGHLRVAIGGESRLFAFKEIEFII
jgi:BirA family biotin operon repressor/biotin-[acetyl-CoA-carboxylase] ligase